MLHTLITAGALFEAEDDPMTAATLLGRVDALQKEMAIAINPTELRLRDETLVLLGARLERDELASALAVGCALDHDAGLTYLFAALDALTNTRSATPTASAARKRRLAS